MTDKRYNHPRPQFMRKKWQDLAGQWQFAFDDHNLGVKEEWFKGLNTTQEITVPYTYETKLSGIHDTTHHQVVWYQKEFEIESVKEFSLVFEGVDYFAQIWLNGQHIGSHMGAYERFTFEVKDYLLSGTNKLVVRVEDSLACEQPRGKQRWLKDNFGCWYVQTTGIWKTVWLEEHLASQSLELVKLTPDLDRDKIILVPKLRDQLKEFGNQYHFEVKIYFADQLINTYKGLLNHDLTPIELDTRVKEDACWGTKEWSPETPNLYDITFCLYDLAGNLLDEVESYFGMRKIAIENGQILLNNRQLYQRLILDQGYWAESGLTPPSVDALEVDIDRIFEMGYNGLRKHQKIEDERFLYLCDKKGMLVWSEMAATYTFNDAAAQKITTEWQKIIEQNYNHPSIITWVPFNESWGIKDIAYDKQQQAFTEGIYHLTKAYDAMRPVITNDGWVHTISDIITLHDYEEFGELFTQRYQDKDKILNNEIQFNKDFHAFAQGYSYKGQPVIISEFGGIAFTTTDKDEWGYGHQVQDESAFIERFDKIHAAIQNLDYIVGFCYTQLTDVEQEVNGLLDVQRKAKVDLTAVAKINRRRLK
ncbi:beta-glucuronidase [Enterococcus saigonensis]|uniref:Beta-glucuronidase n=1 Tax=Enterococcus saigonensis TaxID=1805431 RepID=A0A679IKM1_9ENTE|nr:sugar-binding domain-containing protein [Enterococcus saigonensis]BCA86712.1 beta-glucuronidase [Enterococcus saigonensis]